jgi:hypothetical protein
MTTIRKMSLNWLINVKGLLAPLILGFLQATQLCAATVMIGNGVEATIDHPDEHLTRYYNFVNRLGFEVNDFHLHVTDFNGNREFDGDWSVATGTMLAVAPNTTLMFTDNGGFIQARDPATVEAWWTLDGRRVGVPDNGVSAIMLGVVMSAIGLLRRHYYRSLGSESGPVTELDTNGADGRCSRG